MGGHKPPPQGYIWTLHYYQRICVMLYLLYLRMYLSMAACCEGPRCGYLTLTFPHGCLNLPMRALSVSQTRRDNHLDSYPKHTHGDSNSCPPSLCRLHVCIPLTVRGHVNYVISDDLFSIQPIAAKSQICRGLRFLHRCCRKTSLCLALIVGVTSSFAPPRFYFVVGILDQVCEDEGTSMEGGCAGMGL